jgi:hypothetical protein
MSRVIPLLLAAPLLGACASIVTGENQSVSVQTAPVSGAECSLSNDKGQWFVPSTPGSVTVHRAYGALTVTCKKNRYSGLAKADSSTKGMAFGNILLGGVIGAGVDAGTGAAYDYPAIITVMMTKPE